MAKTEERGKSMSIPEHPGIGALRRVLTALRDDEQGGYHGTEGGLFSAGSAPLTMRSPGYFTPHELDNLFDLVGVKPNDIVPLGECSTCRFDGTDVWAQPCVSCSQPRMTNFVPAAKLKRKSARRRR
jgi:hypothetical protein